MGGCKQLSAGTRTGTGIIGKRIDLMRGSDLNGALAFTDMEPEQRLDVAICGRPLTQVGPKANAFVVSLI